MIWIIIIVAIFALYATGKLSSSFLVETKKTLSESEIVKKFNNILKSIGERNLDVVKKELIECLDQYAIVKEKQFSFTLAQIRKSLEDLTKQKRAISDGVISARTNFDNFMSDKKHGRLQMSEEDAIKKGALLLQKKKINDLLLEKLNDATSKVTQRETDLMNMLTDFNSNLAIKKAEISIMIADSTGIFSGSTIDLKLDNLVKEFQTKVIEGKAAQDVHEKLNDEKDNSTISYNDCVEEFKSMCNA